MNDDKEIEILQFVRKELGAHELGIDDSLTSGRSMTVFEDVFSMMERFSERFAVDCSGINWFKYYPRVGIPFLPNFLLPERMKTDHSPPARLTVKMLVESAKAGRWLYN
ncbi:hypothetical protein COO59_02740 [Mixta theicola]|uniref:Acyl carrier protein n=1 Tax=Mixta theicola TaxID=1458355 RepID=A0A2K1QCV2_9GAMM|nr:DUF1493 family protein [Mixta theicola]PNS12854.1 hypothetical protein COO59_02740 [Mixta theicola]GLR09103.1 hypothetical protein GCM10007905_18230 [Mixta theicola]